MPATTCWSRCRTAPGSSADQGVRGHLAVGSGRRRRPAGGGGRRSGLQAMQALHTLLESSDMLTSMAIMTPRLKGLRRMLGSTGSPYLRRDSTASHYLKLLMDVSSGRRTLGAASRWRSASTAKRWSWSRRSGSAPSWAPCGSASLRPDLGCLHRSLRFRTRCASPNYPLDRSGDPHLTGMRSTLRAHHADAFGVRTEPSRLAKSSGRDGAGPDASIAA
jgi:hypothetical protein